MGEVKKAYRRKALQLHPDHNQSATATQDFFLVNQAYEMLQRYAANPIGFASSFTVPTAPRAGTPEAKAREYEQQYKESVKQRASKNVKKNSDEVNRKVSVTNIVFAFIFLFIVALNFVFTNHSWVIVPSLLLFGRAVQLLLTEWDAYESSRKKK